jgi:arylsulfatase
VTVYVQRLLKSHRSLGLKQGGHREAQFSLLVALAAACSPAAAPFAEAQAESPSILVIWGDDIGWQNVGAYSMGVMGYSTPNLDRIGVEGIRFTGGWPGATSLSSRWPVMSGSWSRPASPGRSAAGRE